jgi:hypothetical protein
MRERIFPSLIWDLQHAIRALLVQIESAHQAGCTQRTRLETGDRNSQVGICGIPKRRREEQVGMYVVCLATKQEFDGDTTYIYQRLKIDHNNGCRAWISHNWRDRGSYCGELSNQGGKNSSRRQLPASEGYRASVACNPSVTLPRVECVGVLKVGST